MTTTAFPSTDDGAKWITTLLAEEEAKLAGLEKKGTSSGPG
jgi:hypothetical protein